MIALTGAGPSGWKPPSAFDEYELGQLLGRGSTGIVYLAHDTLLDRQVAIKFIDSVDDVVLGRFLVEARAAARLQHPNVASIYRVGQLDHRPFLVSEFVRGTSLERLPRPVPEEQLRSIALDLARGLAAAHRGGVLHRDIKPGNAIVAESGEAKLLDFGLAKLDRADALGQTPSGQQPLADPSPGDPPPAERSVRLDADESEALFDLTQEQHLGTPYFMSPEAWARGDVGPLSDLYSLGLVCYELAAGMGPFRNVAVNDLASAVCAGDPPPLAEAAPQLSPRLAEVIDRCIRLDPTERWPSVEAFADELVSLVPRRPGSVPKGNPYRGLRPFDLEHQAFFFGRQRATERAVDRLRSDSLLVVTGDSGVGKSSLCAAGIAPVLIERLPGLRIARFVPGQRPADSLCAALADAIAIDFDMARRAAADERGALVRLIANKLDSTARILVYADQLEELVTISDDVQAELCAELLGDMAVSGHRIMVLATARSDFLSRLEALPGLRDRVSRSLFLLAPLGPDEVRDAIVGPAAVKGVRFESSEMVEGLVTSTIATDAGMPLLQFALAELWDRRDEGRALITERSLDELGGMAGALSRHADGLLMTLPPEKRAAARTVLVRLVTSEGTRARRRADDLAALSPHAEDILDSLTRGRLLVASESPDGTMYEIAHETLVGGWKTLAGWLAEEAETRLLIERIELASGDWQRQGQAPDLLWSGRQLAEVEHIARDRLTPDERSFLDASHRRAARRRWTQRAAVVAALLVAGAIWGAFEIKNRIDRSRDIAAELDRAAEELQLARDRNDELWSVRDSAFAAFDRGDRDEGEQLWRQALVLEETVENAYGDATEPLERALLLDSKRGDVRQRYAEVLFERAELAGKSGRFAARDELIRRMRLYDDGTLTERLTAPARIEIRPSDRNIELAIGRFERVGDVMVLGETRQLGTGTVQTTVEPGSWRIAGSLGGREVYYTFVAEPGDETTVELIVSAEPGKGGMIWIPPGPSRFGSSDDEQVRSFFNAVPQHDIVTDGFWIARHETTFADWLDYLDSLDETERELRTPSLGSRGVQRYLRLTQLGKGDWMLRMQPGTVELSARSGQSLVYPTRESRAEQNWLEMPVVGVSQDDARAFALWLDHTGRVPGARLCTEREWERAARGADRRIFPHGFALTGEQANIDITYDKDLAQLGPDEVGSHPQSRSPYGIDDMAGNVWEWTESDMQGTPAVARGGAFDFAATSARIANRETPEPGYRDISLGLRVCADDGASLSDAGDVR